MNGHHKNVCEFGHVHGQCRCPSPTKTVVQIKCPGAGSAEPDGDAALSAMAPTEPEKRHANLGMATTRELLDEIRARIEVDSANGGGGLDYRTVDSR